MAVLKHQIYFKILLHVLAYMICVFLCLLSACLGHLHGKKFSVPELHLYHLPVPYLKL